MVGVYQNLILFCTSYLTYICILKIPPSPAYGMGCLPMSFCGEKKYEEGKTKEEEC
jgi:hypothetical protein